MVSTRWIRLAAVVGTVALAACSFDRTGSEGMGSGSPDAAAPRPVDGGLGAPDADPADAAALAMCKDDDGDGFRVPRAPGHDCGPFDCNDADELVNPAQDGAFTTPSTDGGFDYNCDGLETPLADTSQGADCNRPPFGSCEGTGWLDFVPVCGQVGVYHRCDADLFNCFEAEKRELVMPCN